MTVVNRHCFAASHWKQSCFLNSTGGCVFVVLFLDSLVGGVFVLLWGFFFFLKICNYVLFLFTHENFRADVFSIKLPMFPLH